MVSGDTSALLAIIFEPHSGRFAMSIPLGSVFGSRTRQRRRIALLAVLVSLPLARTSQAPAQGRVLGWVVDQADGKAIKDVAVLVEGVPKATTRANGRFELQGITTSPIHFEFRLLGYAPRSDSVVIDPNETVELKIALSRKPVELPPIEVSVRSSRLTEVGYYSRLEEAYNGYRFDRADIERLAPQELTDLVQRIPAALVRYGEPGRRVIHFRRWPSGAITFRRRADPNAEYGCVPDLYLDGTLMQDSTTASVYRPRLGDYNVVSPAVIEGIELYVGQNTPMQYKNVCGVVLVWTRRGS
jgi:Carboxypeptidase regulatory-like domain